MIASVVLSLAALAAPQPVTLRYPLAAQASRSVETTVEWADGSRRILGESRLRFEGGRAQVTPPAGATLVQAIGPGLFSRLAGLSSTPVDLVPLPIGTLRVTGLSTSGDLPAAYAVETGSPERAGPPPPLLHVKASERSKNPERPWTSFPLPAGSYALAIDQGPSLPPRLIEKVEVTPGSTTEIALTPIEGREITIVVRSRSDAKALRGARVEAQATGNPTERLLTALLARRTAPSGDDGRLAVGRMPAGGPFAIRVAAAGLRTGVVKLGRGFDAGTREISLAPPQSVEIRVRGLAPRRDDPPPEVSLGWCQTQTPRASCRPADLRRASLGIDGAALFVRVPPGKYQVGVAIPGGGSTRTDLQVPDDPDAPDPFPVEIEVERWTVRGTVRLRDGTPLDATIDAVELIGGLGEGRCAETTSGADGVFQLEVVSSPGRKLSLRGRSERPKAWNPNAAEVALTTETRVIEGIVVELDTTGFELTVRDRKSRQPVPGCAVSIAYGGTKAGFAGAANADAEGKVVQVGVADGSVEVQPQCRGYAPAEETRFTLAPGETRKLEILVDKAGEIAFVVLDLADRPVPGARVLGLGVQLFWYETTGYNAPSQEIGLTDETGSLAVSGNTWAGKPYFVVSAGRALAMGRFPSAAGCPPEQTCRATAHVQPHLPFAGAAITRRSGRPVFTGEVRFSRDGVPIPLDVIVRAAQANGDAGILVENRSPFDERLPALFEPGLYLVRTYKRGADPKVRPVLLPIGTVAVPLLERIELVDTNSD